MKFEWHSFEVEPYLEKGIQPEFMYKDLNPSSEYCTLSDPAAGEYVLTSTAGGSEAVRIPVFALIADGSTQPTSHGSLLTGLGIETASTYINRIAKQYKVHKIIVIMATNCHELENNRYRAYFGITAEVTK